MGPDYFDASLFPRAVFQADLSGIVDGHMATGTLTIRDVARPIEMPFNLRIEGLHSDNGRDGQTGPQGFRDRRQHDR